jgi:hypothetical protein
MALAQALGSDARHRGLVLLADLALHAELAMLHDARDVVPGLQELVEACRGGRPAEGLDELVFRVADRGYDLLLGLRRHRDWTAIRPRAFEVALDAVRRRYQIVVADVEADVEGEDETGSVDVGERNHLARHTIAGADLVLAVGAPGVKGLHALARTSHELVSLGVDAARIVPVLNHVGRSPRQRAELARAYATLRGGRAEPITGPVFIPERRHLDEALAQAAPLPAAVCQPLGAVVRALLGRATPVVAAPQEPVAVVPGSLGSWHDQTDGAA